MRTLFTPTRTLLTPLLILSSLMATPVMATNAAAPDAIVCADEHADKTLASLPQPKCLILQKTFEQARAQNAPLREESHRLSEQLDTLLLAPQFDRKTYLDKSAKLGTLRAKMKATEDDAFTSAAAQFSQEERKILVKWRDLRHHREEWSHREWSPTHDKRPQHQP